MANARGEFAYSNGTRNAAFAAGGSHPPNQNLTEEYSINATTTVSSLTTT